MLRIGEVARQSGVAVATVRYYEHQGLLPAPARTPSGYRHYSELAVQQVKFICHAKTLGFSLKEIAELIAVRADDGARSAEVRGRAQARIRDIHRKIASLQRMEAILVPLVDQCDPEMPLSECPILAALDDGDFPDGVNGA